MPTCQKSDETQLSGCLCFCVTVVPPSPIFLHPPEPGWEQPPFQHRWSPAGPGGGSVQNQSSPTLGCHRLLLWPLGGVTHPKHGCSMSVCVCFQALPASLPCAELSLQTCPCHTPAWMCSAQHSSLSPQGTTLLPCTEWALGRSVVKKVVCACSEFLFISVHLN